MDIQKIIEASKLAISTAYEARFDRFSLAELSEKEAKNLVAEIYKVQVQAQGFNPKASPELSKTLTSVARWLRESRKRGLLLCGDVGTGKTTLAKSICYVLQGIRVFPWSFLPMYKLVRLAESKMDGTLDNIIKNSNLILDDITTEPRDLKIYGTSPNLIPDIIYERYDSNKYITIITTNRSPKDLESIYGKRVSSRLAEMADTIVMAGKDYRTQ